MNKSLILPLVLVALFPDAATAWANHDLPTSALRQKHPTLLKDDDPILQPTTSINNPSLASSDLQDLWHLDDHDNKMMRHEDDHVAYTDKERAELWHLKDDDYHHKVMLDDDVKPDALPAYTDQERAQLWHLQEIEKEIRDNKYRNRNSYTNQDRARLWHLEELRKELAHKEANRKEASYTAQERAELWHLDENNKMLNQELGYSPNAAFTAEELAALWHLDDRSKMRDEKKTGMQQEAYTNMDRAKLWNLQDLGNMMRHSEEWQPYTNEERVPMVSKMSMKIDPNKIRRDVQNRDAYTSQDRAELWHFKETPASISSHTDHHHAPYTAEDRRELWALSDEEQKWVQSPSSSLNKRSSVPPDLTSTVYDPFYFENGVHPLL